MRFLTSAESTAWCAAHDHAADWRYEFSIPADAGARVALCRALWNYETEADEKERLLLIEGWGVWPSGEHLPLFGALRSAFGETRPLVDAPGQVVAASESDAGLSFFVLCALFLWDCRLFSSSGSLVRLSHDEYGFASGPGTHDPTDLYQTLTKFEVLIPRSRAW